MSAQLNIQKKCIHTADYKSIPVLNYLYITKVCIIVYVIIIFFFKSPAPKLDQKLCVRLEILGKAISTNFLMFDFLGCRALKVI